MAAMLQLMYGGYAHVSDSEIESESEINEPLNVNDAPDGWDHCISETL